MGGLIRRVPIRYRGRFGQSPTCLWREDNWDARQGYIQAYGNAYGELAEDLPLTVAQAH